MAAEVAHAEDWVGLAVDLDLVALHDFLYGFSHIAEPHVDACGLDAFVGGFLDGLEQRVELGVEGDGEGRVDEVAVDVSAEVEFADVVVGWVSRAY